MKWLLFLGVRTFSPNNASAALLYVGGPAVVLSLIAMAPDDSYLYAALKVLLFVLETNSTMEKEMNRMEGYQVCLDTEVLVDYYLLRLCSVPKCHLVSI